MEQLFEAWDPSPANSRAAGWPRANLVDAGDALILEAEIAGMDENDLRIETCDDVLTIAGERRLPKFEGYSVHRQERSDVRFSRSFTFPQKIDFEHVSAETKNGILTVRLPKAPESKPRAISVTVA